MKKIITKFHSDNRNPYMGECLICNTQVDTEDSSITLSRAWDGPRDIAHAHCILWKLENVTLNIGNIHKNYYAHYKQHIKFPPTGGRYRDWSKSETETKK